MNSSLIFVMFKYVHCITNCIYFLFLFFSLDALFCMVVLRKRHIFICLRERHARILLAAFLGILYCGYNDAKDAKPMLEEFKKDYSSITEACKAVGFVRDALVPIEVYIQKLFFKCFIMKYVYKISSSVFFNSNKIKIDRENKNWIKNTCLMQKKKIFICKISFSFFESTKERWHLRLQ